LIYTVSPLRGPLVSFFEDEFFVVVFVFFVFFFVFFVFSREHDRVPVPVPRKNPWLKQGTSTSAPS
jgi:quinol-cytochrome oxidoreductase complex cytochrome b subunit